MHCFNTTAKKYSRYRNLKGEAVPDQERLFDPHVRFIGDRVACVVADTLEHARAAARLIKVEYEELPFASNVTEAESGIIDNIHEGGALMKDFVYAAGDADKIARDTIKISTTCHLSRITHVAMEPHACVANYDRGSGELTLYSANQSVFGIRTVVADLFDLPYEKVRVVKTPMGGSFGCKQEWVVEPVAACAALYTKRPVKVVYSRRDTMRSTISRCPLDSALTSQFTRAGKLQRMDADVTLDAGAYLGSSYDYSCVISSKFYRVYQYPYFTYRSRVVYTNTPVSGSFRGWTAPESCLMVEHNLNMAARALHMDPIDLRLKNVALPGDTDPIINEPMGPVRTKECLLLGRERFEWDKRRAENARFNAENTRYKRGIGVACGGHVNGRYPREDFARVDMRIAENGAVMVNMTLHDHGCGARKMIQIITAEALGIPPEQIHVKEGDTAHTPFDYGCFASRTTYVLGRTARNCAEKLKSCMQAGMAEIYKLSPDQIEVAHGEIRIEGQEKIRYTYGEAAVIIYKKLQREVWAYEQYRSPSNPGVTGTHFAQVEVDTHTGMTRILHYLAVHDIGRAINRALCVGQIEGAVMMGSGAALRESMEPHPLKKRLPRGLKDYHLMNAADAPVIDIAFIEDGGTDGPYGCKSIGEICLVPVAPCIVGAVNDALGSDLNSIPLDPDTILAYLKKEAR